MRGMRGIRGETNFRAASLSERAGFYAREFKPDKAEKWLKKNMGFMPQVIAIDAGTDTGMIKNKKWKGSMFNIKFSELKSKIKKYTPEDIYYDRNIYKNPDKFLKKPGNIPIENENVIGQELAFDIDSDNIPCTHAKTQRACNICVGKAFVQAKKMKKELKKIFNNVKAVYSGRGFHLHVFDRAAFYLSTRDREKLNKKFSKYPIDPWVSRGFIRLIRLPFSLNGLVSRKAMPVEDIDKFNSESKSLLPWFLKD